MTHNIIKTENYLLIVSDEEIKIGNYYLCKLSMKPKKYIGDEYFNTVNEKKITAHITLNNSPVLKGVPILPPLEDEVEEAEEVFKEVLDSETKQVYDKMLLGATEHGFIIGYNKAKEKYKYTEEEMKRIYEKGYSAGRNELNSRESDKIKYDYIQSLQKSKMPVGFECEMENKIAIDGHTVIGSEPKTTTNSQGQTVLAGKYIY
jgi:hypothetical protein